MTIAAGLSPDEWDVLEAISRDGGVLSPGECFWTFASIGGFTGLPRDRVQAACRTLRAKRLAEFSRGLWTDDGRPAGSGYAASRDGLRILPPL